MLERICQDSSKGHFCATFMFIHIFLFNILMSKSLIQFDKFSYQGLNWKRGRRMSLKKSLWSKPKFGKIDNKTASLTKLEAPKSKF